MKLTKYMNVILPVCAVVLGILLGAIIMLIGGYNPIKAYSSLFYGAFGDSYYIGETIRQATPYILAGLSVAFAFRTGLFNIGVEGQLIVGWITAVWVGSSFDLPRVIHLPLALLAAGVAGGLWGLIPGFLKARFRVHEVIVTIMMNYIALKVTNYLITNVLSDHGYKTESVKPSATLSSGFLADLTQFSTMHWGIIVALIMVFVMWFTLERTTLGYELRSVGFNQHASQYAGMNVNRNIILAMVISGFFAGMAGAMEGLGTFNTATVKGGFTGVGFDGMAVALLGNNTAIGVVLAAILFGALKIGALEMPNGAGVPIELVDIVIALIIFFVAVKYLIQLLFSRFQKEGK